MSKVYKVLGKKGRITIPFEIRKEIGFLYNDILSFTVNDNAVIVKREKVCDECKNNSSKPKLKDLIDNLSKDEKFYMLAYLYSQCNEINLEAKK